MLIINILLWSKNFILVVWNPSMPFNIAFNIYFFWISTFLEFKENTFLWRNDFMLVIYIDNNTWARWDMEFLFECSTRYFTSERSERVRYRIEHEKRNSISPSNHVLLCLLYKHKSPQYYWNNFYLKATAVSVKAKDKSNSGSTHSNKQFSNTFINTIENFSLLFYFHAIITTLYCFICPYSLVDNLKSPYLLAPD